MNMVSARIRTPRLRLVSSLPALLLPLFPVASSAANGPALTSRPIDSSYRLTFDEEFNGTSLDPSKWTSGWNANSAGQSPPINTNETEAYDPGQVTVSNGMLVISAVAKPLAIGGKTYPYRSGLVKTNGNFSQAYGYFESRICLQGAGGAIYDWPAWWLDGPNWPTTGELDVMEGLSGRASYHFHSPSGAPGADVVGDYTGCHIYAALWTPGSVKYYYDGVAVGSITQGITSAAQAMILNLATGGEGGPTKATQMTVDYVRAYSNSPTAKAVAPQTGYDGPGAPANQTATQAPPPVVPPQYATNLVVDPGFEDGLNGWSPVGNTASATRTTVHSGTGAATIVGGGGVQQRVSGLKPATAYALSAWVRSGNGVCAAIGVKDYGGTQVANCTPLKAYTQITIPFTTGAQATGATVFYYQESGTSEADDFSLIQR